MTEPAQELEQARPTLLSPLPASARRLTAWLALGLTAAAAAAVLLLVVWVLRAAVVPLVMAVLTTALLDPLVQQIRRLPGAGARPGIAAALACLLVVGVVDAAIFVIALTLVHSSESLLSALQQAPQHVSGGASDVAGAASSGLRQLHAGLGHTLVAGAVAGFGIAAQLLTGAVLALALTFFLLRDGRRLPAAVRRTLPSGAARTALRLGRIAYRATAGFMQGTTLVALADASLILVGLLILGVPGAAGLAALVFVGAYIPYIGAFLSGLTAVLVALGDQGLGTALWTLGVILLVQFTEGAFLQPVIQSRTVSLHPGLVMFTVVGGISLGGVLGALLAVPLTAAAVATYRELSGSRASRAG
ncbi:AI-2E family transporter [Streptacidiphilus jiangxiensis]|uniref:Predicted PurR-regulated permease PerM n=1 Tax=Streptacidiphilus jiangxiensis TaxID=235985 RepID=A0A1H7NCR2_STRJI|nr:AI-2E family transporter [Streptacidiphilus jiangxiensis]SEL21300.1 Predicted PurR-regulated permease PerM [Streptacidiphilus jiangxiensis]